MTTYTSKVVVERMKTISALFYPARDVQGASTWGSTHKEALQHIREIIEMIAAELAN